MSFEFNVHVGGIEPDPQAILVRHVYRSKLLFLLLHWKIISSKALWPFMGVFIVVNVWSGKAWIVNVPLYKMTIFRGCQLKIVYMM